MPVVWSGFGHGPTAGQVAAVQAELDATQVDLAAVAGDVVAIEAKTDLTLEVDGDLQLAAGVSLRIPDGEAVIPVNTGQASVGTDAKRFGTIRTADLG